MLAGILCVFGLFLFGAQTGSNDSGSRWEGVRRQRRAQEGANFTEGGGDDMGDRGSVGIGDLKIDIDEETLLAAAAVGVGSLVAAIAGGGALALFDQRIQTIPSRIVYTFPTSTSLRTVSFAERTELRDVTERFFFDVLKTIHLDEVEEVRLAPETTVYMTAAQNFVDDIIDWITGNTRNFGYEMKFTAFVKVKDTKTLTVGQLLDSFQLCPGGCWEVYVADYLAPLESSTNIMSKTEVATYSDRF